MESYIVQLDFSAALDRVSHSGLLFKLISIDVMVVCCPFVQSSSPIVGRKSCLMVLRVSGLCFTPECRMGSRVQSTVGCFAELCFFQFSVAKVLVGLWKQFINNFFFTWGCAADFNNNNKYVLFLLFIMHLTKNIFKILITDIGG